nr:immunoglobulin heavy chain junction region [Mus musculus]
LRTLPSITVQLITTLV